MFTGIVEKTAPIVRVTPKLSILEVEIKKPRGWKLVRGQSVLVDGICSTVTTLTRNSFYVEYMAETLAKTTAAEWQKGRTVNLERSLTLGKLVDGHLLQGHVDRTTKLLRVDRGNDESLLTFHLPRALRKYVALHGSVAVNGASLTVARLKGTTFSVALIPYTLKHTNLGVLGMGESVNIEIDLLMRYLERLVLKPNL